MPNLAKRLHLLLDISVQAATRVKQSLSGGPKVVDSKGASRPGGQVHLAACPVDEGSPTPLLKTGDTKHTMWRTVEWQLLLPIVKDLPRPMLDLGCGDGALGALFTDHIEYGIDGDADAVAQCDPNVYGKTFVGDLRETLPIPAGTLGAAFSNSTLEHVSPLKPALEAVSRALQPGGKLVITVPTIGMTSAVTAGYSSGLATRLNRKLGHHNLLNWMEWEDQLKQVGFDRIEIRGYMTRRAMQWYASRGLFPHPQRYRRYPKKVWDADLPVIRQLVKESTALLREEDATCALIVATKSEDA